MFRRIATILPLFCASVFLSSCVHDVVKHEHEPTAAAKPSTEVTAPVAEQKIPAQLPVGNWYKRYVGVVAGRPAIVHLYYMEAARQATGTVCYYDGSEPVELTTLNDVPNDGQLHLQDEMPAQREGSKGYSGGNKWELELRGKLAIGSWNSKDKLETGLVYLMEDYADGSYPLAVLHHEDSITVGNGHNKAIAHSAYFLTIPGPQMQGADATFLNTVLLHETGGDSAGARNMDELISIWDRQYFKTFSEGVTDEEGVVEPKNYQQIMDIRTLYNDMGLLMLQFKGYDYSGGAHGISGCGYVCVDMQAKKKWTLADMLQVDSVRLSAMLDQEAVRIYKIPSRLPLTSKLLVSSIPVTDNVYFNNKGIVFCYNPYEISSYADGEVCLFLSYERLQPLIRPDFRKRIGL